MKFSHVLPLAALSTAFVLPQEHVFNELSVEENHRGEAFPDLKKHFDEVKEATKDIWQHISKSSKNAIDEAYEYTSETAETVRGKAEETSYDVQSWLATEADDLYDALDDGHHGLPRDGPPHHGPPRDGPPHHGSPRDGPPHHGPPRDGPPHHGGDKEGRPKHPPHHHKPNMTVYQLIAGSKYTTKLAKLINDYPDLVEALNGTKANYTVFAPTDKAFEKIPEHAPKPSKEVLKAILSYHVSPDFYPAARVLVTHTIPTLLEAKHLSDTPEPQRLAIKIGLKGPTVNFYSRIVAVNIFGTNGVIHGVDSIIIPPPNTIKIIDLLPAEFSTLELGLGKTGLLEFLNTTDHNGGTFFAPSNLAFQKLGPKVNAFLFSSYGLKYLKALLSYHVVHSNTLYSDAYYKSSSPTAATNIPKGLFHVDLPTLLEDKHLSIDIARYGGFITIKINGFARVAVQDGVAQDGVIHVVSDVLVPPKSLAQGGSAEEVKSWGGEELSMEELSVEELVERLEPFVGKEDL